MTLWFAALLGLVQGLTEFLPISSTAHLRIVPALLGQPDAGSAFTAVIQLGTLAAVIVYFVRELYRMVRDFAKDPRSPGGLLLIYICLGTIPIGVLGILLKHQIETSLRSLWVIATALVVVGVIMGVVDRRAKQQRTIADLGLLDVLLIGLGQACALIPGVSRSGATLTAALLLGMRRDDAARFSFLLSVPAVGAAGVFELKDAVRDLHGAGAGGSLAPLVVATVVAFVSGWLTINWFLKFLRTRSLIGFSVYRVVVGAALLALLVGKVITA